MNLDIGPQLWTAIGCGLAISMSASGASAASASAGFYALNGSDAKAFVPLVIAGVLAIYGLVIGYMLARKSFNEDMSVVEGYRNFGAGLVVGGATFNSGWNISVFLDGVNYGTHKVSSTSAPRGATDEATTPLLGSTSRVQEGRYSTSQFTKMVVSLFYLEAIGLYGLIVALFLTGPME